MTQMKTKLLTASEVGKLYKMSPRTIARWCREGCPDGTELDAFKLGRVWRIRAAVDGWPIHRKGPFE